MKWNSRFTIVAIVLGSIFLLGCGFFCFWWWEDSSSSTSLFFSESLTTEVYSKVRVSDFVTITNGELKDDFFLDTTKLGEREISFTYQNDRGHRKKGTFFLSIVDTEEPLIGVGKTYTYVKGSGKKLEDVILCADQYDANPTCSIEGEYDLNTIGEYPLIYRARDQSGNEMTAEFTLKVVAKTASSSPQKLSLEMIQRNYVTEKVSFGIDVSKWQKEINFQKVKEAGVEFVMIRLGTQIGPGQDSVLDPYFEQNIKEAVKVGLKVGVYYYSYASNEQESYDQANWVKAQLEPYSLDLPVAFDWECYSYFNSFGLSIYGLNQVASRFLETMESSGYSVMLYGSKNYLEKIWKYLEVPVWLAHYTTRTTYQGDYQMWQFADTAVIPGISTLVDVNLLYHQ